MASLVVRFIKFGVIPSAYACALTPFLALYWNAISNMTFMTRRVICTTSARGGRVGLPAAQREFWLIGRICLSASLCVGFG